MIKVAMQSVVTCADDPAAVLRGLERSLSEQLRDQFVSAAYLWLDTENRKALYSAAGHPPLLRWREGKLERIESNGLLFGVKSGVRRLSGLYDADPTRRPLPALHRRRN